MIDEKIIRQIAERYGIDVRKVDNADMAGFIVENNELKKSIIDEVINQFSSPLNIKVKLTDINDRYEMIENKDIYIENDYSLIAA